MPRTFDTVRPCGLYPFFILTKDFAGRFVVGSVYFV